MQSNWQVLNKPPVIVAIFQLKFLHIENFDLNSMIVNDKNIRKLFTNRQDNYVSNFGMQGTPVPGISLVKAKAETKVTVYAYFNQNQKRKLIIEGDSVTYMSEEQYQGWDAFKKEVVECLNLLAKQLTERLIIRTSIRFINKFSISSFDNPMDYFSQTISTDSDSKYPVSKYSFKLNLQVPDTETIAVVNHALEPNNTSGFDYYFDIDVLDHKQFNFDLQLTSTQLDEIRIVKNDIFFETLKPKTIDLCN